MGQIMTERVETVRITANISNYLAGMEAARTGTTKLTTTLAQQKAAAAAAAEAQGQAATKIGTAMMAIGAVAAVGVALAVKEFADFDAKMSQVQALSHATGDEMKELSDAALHMGQSIGFSASEVADAETELVKAGIGVSDILGGALKGSLELAAAGQIDVADATEIATIALTQFKLQGKDIPHVADLLAAGADKALGGVQDLGEALKSGGLVAAQFGLSLDDTIGTLSAFANAGLIGETAGTDLRQMLLKLANPAAESEAAMKKLGISIYDSNGDFVGAAGLAGQLKDKMTDLDPATRNAALATIFGSRAIAGANVLYQEGAKGIQNWIDQVDDSGFAAKQAAAKMDNLKGDMSKLGAAFDTDLIESGSNANGVLRGLTQGLTGVVKEIGNLPGPVLAVGLGVTALTAGTLLLGGGFLVLVPKIAAAKAALITFQESGISIGKTLGKGGAVVLAVTALAGAIANIGSSSELSAGKLAQVDAVADNLTKKNLNQLFKSAGGCDLGQHEEDGQVQGISQRRRVWELLDERVGRCEVG
jgi:TP901 family phage tail tape measure protein